MPEPARVSDVKVFETKGPWLTKSGGELTVLFSLPYDVLQQYLNFDNDEFVRLKDAGKDIRGLRSYVVSGISKGSVGAQEWHKARAELVRALDGSASWECEDLMGGKQTFTLNNNTVLMVPPGILHTYKALEDNTRLQVIATTLFDPDDPDTHDSFSLDSFYEAQAKYKH